MTTFQRFCRYPLCYFGVHVGPPPRYPHGPIVADCPCCGKTCYFYGLSAHGLGGPPLLLPMTLPSAIQPAR